MRLHFSCYKKDARVDFENCVKRYGQTSLERASAHIVFGGDGATLDVLHQQVEQCLNVPIFALNYGKIGYLTNQKDWHDLPDRILGAERVCVSPLTVQATLCPDGRRVEAYAYNEFSFFRGPSMQAVDLKIIGKNSQYDIFGDGVMIATPLGANAYLKSAGGPQLPRNSNMLAIHGNNVSEPFSMVVPSDTVIAIASRQHNKRPVRIECDSKRAIDGVSRAVIQMAHQRKQTLLFEKIKSR